MDGGIIPWLFAMTLLAAAGVGVWQYVRTQNAKRTNEHSTMTTPGAGPDPRA